MKVSIKASLWPFFFWGYLPLLSSGYALQASPRSSYVNNAQQFKLVLAKIQSPVVTHQHAPSFSLKAAQGDAVTGKASSSLLEKTLGLIDNSLQNSLLKTDAKSVISVATFIAADRGLKKLFAAAGLRFPAPLAGMLGLFAALAGGAAAGGPAAAAAAEAHGFLAAGAALLAKWLPLFFVPSLVVLPLLPAQAPADLAKLALIAVVGWVASISSTAALVQAIPGGAAQQAPAAAAAAPAAKPSPAFDKDQLVGFGALSAALGAAAAALETGAVAGAPSALTNPVRLAFFLAATAFSFVGGALAPAGLRAAVHPLVTCTLLTLAAARAYAAATAGTLAGVLKTYLTKVGGLQTAGAGDLLLALLGPSIWSFACKMYENRRLMARNAAKVVGGCLGGSLFGVFSSAAAVRALGISSDGLRLATLSRQVTTPLAIAMAGLVGADVSVAVALVVATGIIGANFGRKLLDALKVEDPVARGLAMGVSAHGLGTAAMVGEASTGAFALSAIGMALTGAASTVLLSLPPVRRAAITLALAATGGQ